MTKLFTYACTLYKWGEFYFFIRFRCDRHFLFSETWFSNTTCTCILNKRKYWKKIHEVEKKIETNNANNNWQNTTQITIGKKTQEEYRVSCFMPTKACTVLVPDTSVNCFSELNLYHLYHPPLDTSSHNDNFWKSMRLKRM